LAAPQRQSRSPPEAPQLKTDRADVAYQFNEKYVQDLPILKPQFHSDSAAIPGSQKPDGWGHAATENPQGGQQIFTQGQHFSGTGFLLDGTDNQNPILGNCHSTPLDAVTEAKVALQNYDAELASGRQSGYGQDALGAATKSMAAVSFLTRRDRFQARDPFTQSKRDALTTASFRSQMQQFGGTIGGAIIKDKLFFFGDYQPAPDERALGNFTVPTANAVRPACKAMVLRLSQYAGVLARRLLTGA